MEINRDLQLKVAETTFSVGSIWPLREITRPIESEWMFKYYEREVVEHLNGVVDQESYHGFTESFSADPQIESFSARYNYKVEISTNGNERSLVFNSISNHGLLNHQSLTFIKIIVDRQHVKKIEFCQEKIPKNKLQGAIEPKYHEITSENLNRWHFLEHVNRELGEFKFK